MKKGGLSCKRCVRENTSDAYSEKCMGLEFSYEKFQQVYEELSSKEEEKNMLGVKMATDGPVAVLVNNYSYEELFESFRQLVKKVNKVADITTVINSIGESLKNVKRVATRRMW